MIQNLMCHQCDKQKNCEKKTEKMISLCMDFAYKTGGVYIDEKLGSVVDRPGYDLK